MCYLCAPEFSRAVSRRAEFAVRGALGASRAAIGRQVLVESVLLALLSGAAAIAVSIWTLNWLAAAKPLNTTGFWSQYARTFDYFSVSLNPRLPASSKPPPPCASRWRG